jgi:hypothetical protein
MLLLTLPETCISKHLYSLPDSALSAAVLVNNLAAATTAVVHQVVLWVGL